MARPAACTAGPCRNEPSAPRPPRHSEHRRLAWPSFHKAFYELLLPLPGALFLAPAESAASHPGVRGQPRRGVPRRSARTLQRQPGPALPQLPGPRARAATPGILFAGSIPPTLQVAGRAPRLSLPPRPPTPSSARVEGQLPAGRGARRPSRLWPPNLTAPEPSSNLPGWVQSLSVILVNSSCSLPQCPILELRTCARDCATAKNSPGRCGALGGGGGEGKGGVGGDRAHGEAVGWGKLILAGLSRSSCW